MNKFVFLPVIALLSSGCELTLPNKVEYTASRRALYKAADANASGVFAFNEEAKRCTTRINNLRFKAGAERNVSSVLSIVGGSVGLGTGLISATVDNESTKTATAVAAAISGLVGLIVPLIGNPGETVNQLRGSLDKWDKADTDLVTASRLPAGAAKDEALLQIKRDLKSCGN